MKKIYKVVPLRKKSPIYEVKIELTEKKAICTSYVWIYWNSFVKKSLVNFVPPYYILDRWIVNEKNYIIHEIFGDDI